ncbi:MAG: ATP synthase F0 subunit B [Chloracidobacterium sp.]|nr:ATP synthase F0 subunit B [Chloracidobacterium sp.]MDW8216123.1 ATP synthase F0 subunit B [Acidobacteriota bacterium]
MMESLLGFSSGQLGRFLAAESSLLTPDWSLFVTVGVFLIVAYLLNVLVFKPVLAVLEERTRLTSGARRMLGDYDQRLAAYEAALRDARVAAAQLIAERRAAALQRRTEIIEQAKQAAAAETAAATQALSAQVAAAKEALLRDAEQLAASIAETILGRRIGASR